VFSNVLVMHISWRFMLIHLCWRLLSQWSV